MSVVDVVSVCVVDGDEVDEGDNVVFVVVVVAVAVVLVLGCVLKARCSGVSCCVSDVADVADVGVDVVVDVGVCGVVCRVDFF